MLLTLTLLVLVLTAVTNANNNFAVSVTIPYVGRLTKLFEILITKKIQTKKNIKKHC